MAEKMTSNGLVVGLILDTEGKKSEGDKTEDKKGKKSEGDKTEDKK